MAQEPTSLDDLKDLLEDTLEVAQQNNKILKAMRRDAWIGGILKTLLWVVLVIGSLYFSMQFLEPMIGKLGQGTDQTNPDNFKMILDLYQGNLPQ